MKNCPQCESNKFAEFSKKDMQVNYLGALVPRVELKYGRLLQCPDCENFWFEDIDPYPKYRLLLKEYLQPTLEWNSTLPQASSEQKTILLDIKANPVDSYGSNRNFLDFPASCYYADEWIDCCMLRFQKLPPFLAMFTYAADFISIDRIRDIRPSPFALPYVIRSFMDLIDELGLGDRSLMAAGPNQKLYSVWVQQNFFFSDGVKGSELSLESFLSKRTDKVISYEQSSMSRTYVIADWDEELNSYRK